MSGRQQQYNRRVTVNHIDVFVVCGLCGASDPAQTQHYNRLTLSERKLFLPLFLNFKGY